MMHSPAFGHCPLPLAGTTAALRTTLTTTVRNVHDAAVRVSSRTVDYVLPEKQATAAAVSTADSDSVVAAAPIVAKEKATSFAELGHTLADRLLRKANEQLQQLQAFNEQRIQPTVHKSAALTLAQERGLALASQLQRRTVEVVQAARASPQSLRAVYASAVVSVHSIVDPRLQQGVALTNSAVARLQDQLQTLHDRLPEDAEAANAALAVPRSSAEASVLVHRLVARSSHLLRVVIGQAVAERQQQQLSLQSSQTSGVEVIAERSDESSDSQSSATLSRAQELAPETEL